MNHRPSWNRMCSPCIIFYIPYILNAHTYMQARTHTHMHRCSLSFSATQRYTHTHTPSTHSIATHTNTITPAHSPPPLQSPSWLFLSPALWIVISGYDKDLWIRWRPPPIPHWTQMLTGYDIGGNRIWQRGGLSNSNLYFAPHLTRQSMMPNVSSQTSVLLNEIKTITKWKNMKNSIYHDKTSHQNINTNASALHEKKKEDILTI